MTSSRIGLRYGVTRDCRGQAIHPTVASSLRLSHAIVRAAQHLQEHDPEGFDILKEASLRWASQLARAPNFEGLFSKNSVIPIEILNIFVLFNNLEVMDD